MRMGTTKQSEKVRYLQQIGGVMISYHNMVSLQNGDTRGRPPPPSDATASDSRTFFGLHLYLGGRCCKNPLSARGLVQCKSSQGIACLVSVTNYCTTIQ